MARNYATAADLQEWTGAAPPANAAGLLRSASSLVERDTLTAIYAHDTDGYATEPGTATAFREAVCAQAAFWAANGLDPTAGALGIQAERVASSKSIKGASVSYDTADAAATKAARVAALETLCSEAWRILSTAGLTPAGVR
ncbi:hypothetical protein GCM10023081_46800 [Arthrobacter ginkgonis]|uniref:Uncharacterized protein n=1 Tax=Arthrobacter ginkgonis TaxID=1630594 RepID=A0ABP7DGK4_9MICC